ncbi:MULTISPECIES: hypothetical protein [unclassified Beijerinckia]|uniref:hypothetical protein n=1 Tax=unclassified Beijerinckia TaxID=2638183 RepID=UPI00089D9B59|nr:MULTISPECIES: hypothetical protein [unclassified Beijerinckia]MDH7794238.1 hypothetical protein [Beijerinckia sp. GAS462]SEB56546.1 hypothetical protein SAMN05443249_0505 [Beijerinckia sp. 28-YEA-48]
MKIVSDDSVPWLKDHPTGSLAFKYLLTGDEDAADNFVLLLARQDADFTTERHRHNFDQFRFPLCGDMNVGQGIKLREGQLGYFTEGAPYGPQDDPLGASEPGSRFHLTLQFGGSSGYGYLGPDRLRACREALRQEGEFIDVLYRRRDGKMMGGLDAVWQHAFGTRLEYPKARYPSPIIMDPKSFRWIPDPGLAGVNHKHLGTYTERGTWAEIVHVQADARWIAQRKDARVLITVLSGTGRCENTSLSRLSTIQAEPGELVDVVAESDLELLIFGLPLLNNDARRAA